MASLGTVLGQWNYLANQLSSRYPASHTCLHVPGAPLPSGPPSPSLAKSDHDQNRAVALEAALSSSLEEATFLICRGALTDNLKELPQSHPASEAGGSHVASNNSLSLR